MVDQTELDDVDQYYIERISKHIDFPNNEKSLKLFRQYRNKLFKKQLAADKKRFCKNMFLAVTYRDFSQEPSFSPVSPAVDALVFAKHVLEEVLEIIAYRDASMSFMLQLYENEPKLKTEGKPKPDLRRVK